jgi:hypothetical protein
LIELRKFKEINGKECQSMHIKSGDRVLQVKLMPSGGVNEEIQRLIILRSNNIIEFREIFEDGEFRTNSLEVDYVDLN